MRNDTNFLRFIAILLIYNSHLYDYYPISIMATGGALGNSLFFLLTGYGLAYSAQKNPIAFKTYVGKRLTRLYPTVWIVTILIHYPILVHRGTLTFENFLPKMGMLFYPSLWFIQAILLFYLIHYFVVHYYSKKLIYTLFSFMSLLYVYCYIFELEYWKYAVEDEPFKLIFYYMMVLLGTYLARLKTPLSGAKGYEIVLCIGLLGATYVHKYLVTKNMFVEFQFVQQLLLFPVVYYMMKIAKTDFVTKLIMQGKRKVAIERVASCTLEIYMVHSLFIHYLYGILFPFNIIALTTITLVISIWVNNLSARVANIGSTRHRTQTEPA